MDDAKQVKWVSGIGFLLGVATMVLGGVGILGDLPPRFTWVLFGLVLVNSAAAARGVSKLHRRLDHIEPRQAPAQQ